MNRDYWLGALIAITILSISLGIALHQEGVGTHLAIIISILTWWTLGLLYEIAWGPK